MANRIASVHDEPKILVSIPRAIGREGTGIHGVRGGARPGATAA